MSPGNGPQSGSIPAAGVPVGPPQAGRAGRSRRDAARNTAEVLGAARALFAAKGVDAVSMDEVARAAGVGKGTVYRVVGSRSGLAELLLDDAERELQEAILTGPPPLGRGAPAGERLEAFVAAYVELLAANADLLVETERGVHGARFATGAYAFWHSHVRGLLAEAAGTGAGGGARPDLLADAVLATLSAELFTHLRSARRAEPREVAAMARTVVAALAGAHLP